MHAVAAYADPAGHYICKVMQCELGRRKDSHGRENRNAAFSRITDGPERNIRLWNTYMPPELRTAKTCTVTLPDERQITAWVAPFLKHVGPPITPKDVEEYAVDAVRGNPSLGIPGGRLIADAPATESWQFGNIMRVE